MLVDLTFALAYKISSCTSPFIALSILVKDEHQCFILALFWPMPLYSRFGFLPGCSQGLEILFKHL